MEAFVVSAWMCGLSYGERCGLIPTLLLIPTVYCCAEDWPGFRQCSVTQMHQSQNISGKSTVLTASLPIHIFALEIRSQYMLVCVYQL